MRKLLFALCFILISSVSMATSPNPTYWEEIDPFNDMKIFVSKTAIMKDENSWTTQIFYEKSNGNYEIHTVYNIMPNSSTIFTKTTKIEKYNSNGSLSESYIPNFKYEYSEGTVGFQIMKNSLVWAYKNVEQQADQEEKERKERLEKERNAMKKYQYDDIKIEVVR